MATIGEVLLNQVGSYLPVYRKGLELVYAGDYNSAKNSVLRLHALAQVAKLVDSATGMYAHNAYWSLREERAEYMEGKGYYQIPVA